MRLNGLQCPLLSESGQNVAVPRMSALCHKRTHAPQQTASLFDHLVGAADYRQWDIQPERLGGLQIDDQFDFGNLLDRQVGGLLTLENANGIVAGQAGRGRTWPPR